MAFRSENMQSPHADHVLLVLLAVGSNILIDLELAALGHVLLAIQHLLVHKVRIAAQ